MPSRDVVLSDIPDSSTLNNEEFDNTSTSYMSYALNGLGIIGAVGILNEIYNYATASNKTSSTKRDSGNILTTQYSPNIASYDHTTIDSHEEVLLETLDRTNPSTSPTMTMQEPAPTIIEQIQHSSLQKVMDDRSLTLKDLKEENVPIEYLLEAKKDLGKMKTEGGYTVEYFEENNITIEKLKRYEYSVDQVLDFNPALKLKKLQKSGYGARDFVESTKVFNGDLKDKLGYGPRELYNAGITAVSELQDIFSDSAIREAGLGDLLPDDNRGTHMRSSSYYNGRSSSKSSSSSGSFGMGNMFGFGDDY